MEKLIVAIGYAGSVLLSTLVTGATISKDTGISIGLALALAGVGFGGFTMLWKIWSAIKDVRQHARWNSLCIRQIQKKLNGEEVTYDEQMEAEHHAARGK